VEEEKRKVRGTELWQCKPPRYIVRLNNVARLSFSLSSPPSLSLFLFHFLCVQPISPRQQPFIKRISVIAVRESSWINHRVFRAAERWCHEGLRACRATAFTPLSALLGGGSNGLGGGKLAAGRDYIVFMMSGKRSLDLECIQDNFTHLHHTSLKLFTTCCPTFTACTLYLHIRAHVYNI